MAPSVLSGLDKTKKKETLGLRLAAKARHIVLGTSSNGSDLKWASLSGGSTPERPNSAVLEVNQKDKGVSDPPENVLNTNGSQKTVELSTVVIYGQKSHKTTSPHHKNDSSSLRQIEQTRVFISRIENYINTGEMGLFGGGHTKSNGSNEKDAPIKAGNPIMKNIIRMMSDPETRQALENASRTTGVNIESLMTMAIIESSGKKNIGTNKYGYTGLMQLGKAAVSDIQKKHPEITFSGVQNSVETNALGGAYYWVQNAQILNSKKIEVNVLHQYLAHQQGAGGLNTLLKTLRKNPNAPITGNQITNLPAKFKNTHSNITQQQFYNFWKGQIGDIQRNVSAYMRSR